MNNACKHRERDSYHPLPLLLAGQSALAHFPPFFCHRTCLPPHLRKIRRYLLLKPHPRPLGWFRTAELVFCCFLLHAHFIHFSDLCTYQSQFLKVAQREQLPYSPMSTRSQLVVSHFHDLPRPSSRIEGLGHLLLCIPQLDNSIPMASVRECCRRIRYGRRAEQKKKGTLAASQSPFRLSQRVNVQHHRNFGQGTFCLDSAFSSQVWIKSLAL